MSNALVVNDVSKTPLAAEELTKAVSCRVENASLVLGQETVQVQIATSLDAVVTTMNH